MVLHISSHIAGGSMPFWPIQAAMHILHCTSHYAKAKWAMLGPK
jgi:hypothetical protein